MDILKNKILEVFKITAKIVNETDHEINKFINEEQTFKFTSKFNIEQFVYKELLEGNTSFEMFFDFLRKNAFCDFNHEIEIYITSNKQKSTERHEIFFEKDFFDKNDIEIKNFFRNSFIEIKKNEIYKLTQYLEDKKTKKSYNFLIKKQLFDINDAFKFFLIGDYESAQKIFQENSLYYEMYFYCCIFLDQNYQLPFSYYSENSIECVRKVYFLREYFLILNKKSFVIYYMLNSLSDENKIIKLIFELELATFLIDYKKFENRIILSLYKCIDIAYEYNLKSICLEFTNELDSYKILPLLELFKKILSNHYKNKKIFYNKKIFITKLKFIYQFIIFSIYCIKLKSPTLNFLNSSISLLFLNFA